MTRQGDLKLEERRKSLDDELVRTCEYLLVGSLSSAGADLLGFSANIDQWQCQITLRAIVDDLHSVAFVYADTLPDCLRKCVRMASYDQLRWKKDEWYKPKV